MTYEEEYLLLCKKILEEGEWVYNERTKKNCISIPEYEFTYNLSDTTPPFKTVTPSYPVSACAEILGYLRGYEWATEFDAIGSKTWFSNANETPAWLLNENRLGENHLGKIYGAALEHWELPELFEKLNQHYDDRGLIINFWRPEKFKETALRPCMYEHVFSIVDGHLNLHSIQRSCDVPNGLGFNSIQVYFLAKLFAKCSGLKEGTAKHTIINPHIYEDQVEAVEEMLQREPLDIKPEFKVAGWVETFDDIVSCDTHARDYIRVSSYDKSLLYPKISFPFSA